MTLTQSLYDAARPIWARYFTHPFVQGIAQGTLDAGRFRHYIVQDALYLQDYARIFALGAAKAQEPALAGLFARYIPVMNGEMDVHSGYLARLGVTQQELDAAPRALASLSYTSYMLRAAYEGGAAEILAAVLPCAWSYEDIARRMAQARPDAAQHPFYGDWVRGYASEDYARDNAALLRALDSLAADAGAAQRRRLTDIFLACSRYELAFWDMAWNRKL